MNRERHQPRYHQRYKRRDYQRDKENIEIEQISNAPISLLPNQTPNKQEKSLYLTRYKAPSCAIGCKSEVKLVASKMHRRQK
mmetsp:Transcript_7705/g.8716  ORF Transcript_7705/g.8716 Transcript_7705/m.8716 type:complete len:82 (+) Transcript_7705:74-319(+)